MKDGRSQRPVYTCDRCRRMKSKCVVEKDTTGCQRCRAASLSCEATGAPQAKTGGQKTRVRHPSLPRQSTSALEPLDPSLPLDTPQLIALDPMPTFSVPSPTPSSFDMLLQTAQTQLQPTLTREQTAILFQYYQQNNHPTLPVVTFTGVTPHQLQIASPLLLHAICTIASRSHDSSVWRPDLPATLLSETLDLLATLTRDFFKATSTISHLDVQALIILAAYPAAPSETDGFADRRADWSWMLLGQAIRLADVLGLFDTSSYPRGLEEEYARTALSCFLLDVNCCLANSKKPTAPVGPKKLPRILQWLKGQGDDARRDSFIKRLAILTSINARILSEAALQEGPVEIGPFVALLRVYNQELDDFEQANAGEIAAPHSLLWTLCAPVFPSHRAIMGMHSLYSKAVLNSRAIPVFLKQDKPAERSELRNYAALAIAFAQATVDAVLALPGFAEIYKATHDAAYHVAAFPVLLLLHAHRNAELRALMGADQALESSAKMATLLQQMSHRQDDIPNVLARYIQAVLVSLIPASGTDFDAQPSAKTMLAASKTLAQWQDLVSSWSGIQWQVDLPT